MVDRVKYIAKSAVTDKTLEDKSSGTITIKQENVEENTCLLSASLDAEHRIYDSEKGIKVESHCCKICPESFASETLLEEHLKIHVENDDHSMPTDILTGLNEQPQRLENEGRSLELSVSGEIFSSPWSRNHLQGDGAPFATFPEHFMNGADLQHPKQVHLLNTGKQPRHESRSATLPHSGYSQGDMTRSRDGPMLGTLFYSQAFNTLQNSRSNEQRVSSNEILFTCDLCTETFALPSQLITHRASHHDEDILKSSVRNKVFQTRQNLDTRKQSELPAEDHPRPVSSQEGTSSSLPKVDDHLVRSAGKTRPVCSYCKKTFACNSHRVEHERIHTNEKPFSCGTCGRAFAHRCNLKQHIETHARKKDTPQCTKCGATFKSLYSLTKHRKLHTDHICRICKNKFPTEDLLKQHLKHHGKVAYVCDVCNKNCSTYVKLDKHHSTHHKFEHRCNKCGLLFKTVSQYNKHRCSKEAAKHYKCKYCHKRFTKMKDLNLHLRVHTRAKRKPRGAESVQLSKRQDTAEKKYPCGICSGCFESYYRLMKHRRLHKDRPFMCKVCEETFVSDSDLHMHISSGCGDSILHVCSQCNKTFKTESALKRHKIKHVLETPYTCGVCNQPFKTASHLTEHLEIHKKPYVCKTCNKRFVKRRSLRQHVQTCSKSIGSTRMGNASQIAHFRGQVSDLPSPQVAVQETVKLHHGASSSELLMCDSCGMAFRSLGELQLHMRPGFHEQAPANPVLPDSRPRIPFQQEGNMFQCPDNGFGESRMLGNVMTGLLYPSNFSTLDPGISMSSNQIFSNSLVGPQIHGHLYPSHSQFASTTGRMEFHIPDPLPPIRPEAQGTSTSRVFQEALGTLYTTSYEPQLTPDPSVTSTGRKISEPTHGRKESRISETDQQNVSMTCLELTSSCDPQEEVVKLEKLPDCPENVVLHELTSPAPVQQVEVSDGNELTAGIGGFEEPIGGGLKSVAGCSVKAESDGTESTVSYSDGYVDDDFSPEESMPLDKPEEKNETPKSHKQSSYDSESPADESRKDESSCNFTDDSILDGNQEFNNRREVRLVLKKMQMYTCDMCKKVFDMKSKLSRHMMSHSNERPFQCKLCHSTFKHRWHLGNHEVTNHGKTREQLKMETVERRLNTFHCGFCNKNFDQRFLLKHHQLSCSAIIDTSSVKERTEKQKCSICTIKFPNKKVLKKHIKSHSEAARRKFNYSPKVSSDQEQGAVIKTTSDNHTISKSKELVPNCRNEDNPGSESRTETTEKRNDKFKCQICQKFFSTRAVFTHHIARHTDERRYKCRLCGRCYKHKHHRNSHACPSLNTNADTRSHTIKQMFKCSQCPEFFHSYSQRLAHQQDMHKSILFECDKCDDTFLEKIPYWVHLCQVHKSPSQEAWERAASLYESHQVRNQHSNLVHEEQIPLKCVRCCKNFSSRDDLAEHINNQHKDGCDRVLDCPKELEEHSLSCTLIMATVGATQSSENEPRQVDVGDDKVTEDTGPSKTDYSFPEANLEYPRDGVFKCHICGKCWTSRSSLKNHFVTHSTERRFVCEDCGCSYKRGFHLKAHRQVCTSRSEQTENAKPSKEHRDPSMAFNPPHDEIHSRTTSGQQGHGVRTDESQDPITTRTVKDTEHNSNASGNVGEHQGLDNVARPCGPELGPGDDCWSESDAKTSTSGESSKKLKDHPPTQQNKASTSRQRPLKKGKPCHTCGKEFGKYSVLTRHVIDDHNRKWPDLFPCDYCGAWFSDPVKLDRHEARHTLRWKCHVCSKGFAQKSYLTDHLKIHSTKKEFMCDVCGKTFSKMTILKLHQFTHSDVYPFQCKLCKRAFKRKGLLSSHQRFHNVNVKVKNLMCDKCGKQYRKQRDLNIHIITAHQATPWLDENDKPIVCHLCGKPFRDIYRLAIHTRRGGACIKKDDYVCQTCGKSFPKKAFLVMHSRSHQEKRTACKYCNKVLCHKYLAIHERIHTNIRPYICKFCQKAFFTKNTLDDHQNIHTGKTPHKCKFCGAAFKSRGTLSKHFRVHRKQDRKQDKKASKSPKRKAGGTKGVK